MERLIIVSIILMALMLLFVFILFKNIVKKIDDNAKKYFLNKMQDYDYILEKKQGDLSELNEKIEVLKQRNINLLYSTEANKHQLEKVYEEDEEKKPQVKQNLSTPEYRDSIQFFNNYKELKKMFSVDNEKIITDFIKKHKNIEEEKEYKKLQKLREKFDNESIYGCITLKTEDQIKVLSDILTASQKKLVGFDILKEKKNFNINDLINYIDNRMKEIEPTIYIYVNGVNINYNSIDKNIVTKQYANMAEGIIIQYRNKMYDYSI